MVYGCGNKTVKFLMFIINFFICVAGGAVMGVGLYANLSSNFTLKLQEVMNQNHVDYNLEGLRIAVWALVGIGGLLFLTGFLGCCGAACESRLLLGVFFVIILVLFVALLGAGIAVFVKKDDFKKLLTDGLDELAKKATDKDALNEIMNKFHCCGIKGGAGDATKRFPVDSVLVCPADLHKYNNCIDVLWNIVEDNAPLAGGVAIGVLVIQLLAMIFSCVMCNAIAQKNDYRGYA